MASGKKPPKDSIMGPQIKDKTVFGAQETNKHPEPIFGDGRLSKQHGEAGKVTGFDGASTRAKSLQKKPRSVAVAPQAIPRNKKTGRKKADLTKKIPPISKISAFGKLSDKRKVEKTAGFFVWVFSAFVGIFASIAMVALYGIYYAFFAFLFIFELAANALFVVFQTFMKIFGAAGGGILSRLAPFLTTMAIIFFSGYMFMKYNPEYFYKVRAFGSKAINDFERATGIPIPVLPDVQMFFSPDEAVRNMNDLANSLSVPDIDFGISDSFSNAFSGFSMPNELGPIMSFDQSPEMLNYFKNLINSGNLGNKAEGAVPMLEQNLYSTDRKLSQASGQALRNIDTPGSKYALEKYKAKIK